MSVELFGFLVGVGLAAMGGLAFVLMENGRAVALAYRRAPVQRHGGNALIWPSH